MAPASGLKGSMRARRSLSVVIPAYNEADRLPKTVREIHRFLVESDYDAELIVVDDGSQDQTLQVARDLRRSCPLLRILSLDRNRGKGRAVRTGILAATKDAVLFSDADNSTSIADIVRLWPLYDRGYEVIVGSRRAPGSSIDVPQPLNRRLIGSAFSFIVSLIAIRGIRDTQCGFKLFGADAAKSIFSKVNTAGWAFDVEVLMRARYMGLRIGEVGIHWANASDSRVDPIRDSVRMLVEVLRMRALLF